MNQSLTEAGFIPKRDDVQVPLNPNAPDISEKLMKLQLQRKTFTNNSTGGELYIDGTYFCDTLEDTCRNLNNGGVKIKHETAIPKGTYSVIVNESTRFKRRLPRLLNVPQFEGVLIHAGNTASDTSGCILAGQKYANDFLSNSTPYEIEIVKRLDAAIGEGKAIIIEIV